MTFLLNANVLIPLSTMELSLVASMMAKRFSPGSSQLNSNAAQTTITYENEKRRLGRSRRYPLCCAKRPARSAAEHGGCESRPLDTAARGAESTLRPFHLGAVGSILAAVP